MPYLAKQGFLYYKQLPGESLGRQRGAADGRLGDCGHVFEDSVSQEEQRCTYHVCSELLSPICKKISPFSFLRKMDDPVNQDNIKGSCEKRMSRRDFGCIFSDSRHKAHLQYQILTHIDRFLPINPDVTVPDYRWLQGAWEIAEGQAFPHELGNRNSIFQGKGLLNWSRAVNSCHERGLGGRE